MYPFEWPQPLNNSFENHPSIITIPEAPERKLIIQTKCKRNIKLNHDSQTILFLLQLITQSMKNKAG